jgi:hypothetical protein
VDWDDSDDPEWGLQWWKANTLQFPIMSRVSSGYLAIPVSEIDVERLFSSSRDLVDLWKY